MAVTTESYAGKIQRKLLKKQKVIEAASGRKKADLVLKNATFVNVFSNELTTCDIACANGLIVGLGDYDGVVEYDMTGKIVCPGFIDAHIHLESSLVSPKEFVRATLPHGTTTVITDPHEITNVMGTDGIDYMFQATEGLPIDVRFMLPSCVPATPMDESGANLDYRAIDSFYDYPRVQGLAEMMNAYGVIHNDKEVVSKIVAAQAHHKKIDGHAPGLLGKDLDTYIAAGVYSDHECSTIEDALEKLKRGQFIMIREGTAARNLEALAGLLSTSAAEPPNSRSNQPSRNAASALTHKSAAMAAASAAARMGRAVFFVLIPAFCIVCSTIRAASSGCNGASGYSRSGA